MANQKFNYIDNHKLRWHLDKVTEWLEKGDCFPIYVEIGLTNLCNNNCIFCGLDWARGKDVLKTETLLKNLEDMANHGVKAVCYSGAGEPLLYKELPLVIRKTKELGIDVALSTNTSLFNEKKAQEILPYATWIRFSIDSATAKTHAKIHRPKKSLPEREFPLILNNLAKAVEMKRKNNYSVTLGVQFLLLEENMHEVLGAAKIFRDIGMDNLQIKPYSQNPYSINKIKIDYSKFNGIENKLNALSTENFHIIYRSRRMKRVENDQEYNTCEGLPFWTIINEKGKVIPCHNFYNKPKFSYGNIYDNLFSEIWKNQKRQKVLQEIRQKGINKCKKGCRGDLINHFLWNLKQGKFTLEGIHSKEESPPEHINFV
jgi:radical SAM protein with 4Fe4S-binding SPASM domain